MNSALVPTDMGLRVHRFACVEDARRAQANIESDGIGASLREVVCCWCGKPTGAAVLCDPGVLKAISDGMCAACDAGLRNALDVDYPVGGEASSLVESSKVVGTVAPFVRREHASGGPASSSDFNRWGAR